MPFVDAEDTNFAPYPIHMPVACGRDSGDRTWQGQTLALRNRILRFSLGQNLRAGQGSRPNSHGLRPGMAILGTSSQRLEFEPPHASSLDATETRERVRPRTMACRYRARISREGNSVL